MIILLSGQPALNHQHDLGGGYEGRATTLAPTTFVKEVTVSADLEAQPPKAVMPRQPTEAVADPNGFRNAEAPRAPPAAQFPIDPDFDMEN